jgi:hypothetical protein
MADPRVFTLIGNFTDNITPALAKINKSLEQVKTNLESVSKVTKPLKSDFKELADYSKNFSSSLRSQASDMRDATAAMKAFRSEMGRMNRAYKAGGTRAIQQAGRAVAPPPPPSPPRIPSTLAPRSRKVGGGGVAAAVGGGVAGFELGNMITDSIVRGFQLGVNIMVTPFRYASNAFGERIRDELSDIQSAGGLFATDRRYQLNMFKNFNEARRTQELLNARLAKSAAELPGETAQYVREAKRITDTMIGAMGKSQEAFVKFAETLGAKQGDRTDALATVIQKFTEKAVLLGQQPGGGGTRSIYGVPQLLEMMVNMPQLNLRAMSYRYASLRDNPLLANALQQGEATLNATAAGTAERLAAIMKILDEALPNEVVSSMRNSMDGIIQTIKSAIIDPETGIFGLGRKMMDVVVPRVDSLGRYLDKAGNVVDDISKAETETASLYSLLRESIAGFIVPLQGLINILPQIYDPLKAIGLDLVEFRNTAQRFLATFNGFTKTFENMGGELKKTASARGGLLTIANLLQNLGKIDTPQFQKYSKMLQDPKANLGAIAKNLFSELFDSKFMEMIGKVIGNIIGGTLKMVGDLMAGVTDMTNAGPFAKGLKQGFDEAQGAQGIGNIFKSLFRVIGNALITLFKSAPFEMSILTALTVGMPLITGAIAAGITALFERAALGGFGAGGGAGGKSGVKTLLSSQARNASKAGMMLPGVKGAAALATKGKMAGIGVAAAAIVKLATVSPKLMKVGESVTKLAKAAPGLNILFAGADFAFGKMAGESTAEAAGGAAGGLAGGLIGAAIGTAILPGVGTAIGSVLGTFLGDWIGTNLAGVIKKFLTDPSGSLKAAIDQATTGLKQSETNIKEWFWSLPQKFGQWSVELENKSQDDSARLKFSLDQLQYKFSKWIGGWGANVTKDLQTKLQNFNTRVQNLFKNGINWNSMADSLSNAVIGWLTSVKNKVMGWVSGAQWIQDQINKGKLGAKKSNTETWGQMRYDGKPKSSIPLNAAIASEMRNKPSGSDLVIANSSEMVIPAAGGYGVSDLMETLRSGFNALVTVYLQAQQKQDQTLKSINQTLITNQQQTNSRLSKLETKFTTPGLGGLGGASIGGGVDAFTGIAQRYGLQMTSGYRPGDPGYHGANRARDFSNGTGPTPQMMQFAQFLASTYGSSLKELIYTPLGYSIKNGQKVPPYATAGHYNHVHVAYATGYGMPFTTAMEAMRFERAMTPGSVKVGSVTGNSAEGFGNGGTTINGGINVTVNGSGVNDADELASIVALKIGDAVAQARAASVFV